MMQINPPTTTERVRVTVPVSPEVLDAFQRLAKATGTSTGRAMGDWLMDTLEGAEFMAHTLEKAKAAPRLAVQELKAMTVGMGDELDTILAGMRAKAKKGATGIRRRQAERGGGGAAATSPPVCNTGGKVPKSGNGTGGKS